MIDYFEKEKRPVGRPPHDADVVYKRRRELFLAMCAGKRIREIAQEMGVPQGTIGPELAALRKQHKVKNNLQLVAVIVFGLQA